MNKIFHQQNNQSLFFQKRMVFQGVDKAPPSSDTMKGPEAQTEAQAVSEVASQSPSQIFNDTISAGGSMQGQYTQGTSSLASLVTNDPIFTGNWTSTTTAAAPITTKSTSARMAQ